MTTTFDIEHHGQVETRDGELSRDGMFRFYCETCHHYDETEINND